MCLGVPDCLGNCTDCYEEDVDIDGGLYVQTALAKNFSAVSPGVHYIHYLDDEDGLADSLRFAIGTRF